MQEVKQIHFTYEPISLTKLLLQMYAEKFIERNTFKAKLAVVYSSDVFIIASD
jgi:hypothetical protein